MEDSAPALCPQGKTTCDNQPSAVQEDVDIIGSHIMQGAPKVLIPILLEKMKEKGIADVPVVIGGIIPDKDEAICRRLGVREVFHPLTPLETIVASIRSIGKGVALARAGR